jgi:hypothetical protein
VPIADHGDTKTDRHCQTGTALSCCVDRLPYLVLDGTLIAIARVAADRPLSSGKHRWRGMNLQVLVGPGGALLWVSASCAERCTT